ncbi:MAG: hydrogenase maturation protease [Terracidiphilus sp.]|jgi:hydrogenase maturation protease
MSPTTARCLILACGNTLRGDDGVGLWLAEWAERRFCDQPGVRIIADHQWTPELAEDVARAQFVLFIDCAIDSLPGAISLTAVEPAASAQLQATHHIDAAQMLALGRELYVSLPRKAQLLTIGAAATELGEEFSAAVSAALPEACRLIEKTISDELRDDPDFGTHSSK